MARVFISYSHLDQAIARRIARRMSAYGVTLWLDEQRLNYGDSLSTQLRDQLERADVIVVVASNAATRSPWVAMEIGHARALPSPRRICPIFVEPVQRHSLFEDALGVDATDPHQFEGRIIKATAAIVGEPLPSPDPAVLRAGLEACGKEQPAISLLVEACLGGQGLPRTQLGTVLDSSFHELDFALNALFDIAIGHRNDLVAAHAAALFLRAGVGTYALMGHAARRSAADTRIAEAVGAKLNEHEFDAALQILATCNPPDDQALSQFIVHCGSHLSREQERKVIGLVMHPSRPPAEWAFEAVYEGIGHLSDRSDLYQLLQHWISEGFFDGQSETSLTPKDLAECARVILANDDGGYEKFLVTLSQHVRRLARSKNKTSVKVAIDHVRAAADCDSPALGVLCTQCEGAPSSHEWSGWEHAEAMRDYIRCYVEAARTGKDWNAAREAVRQEAEMRRQAALLDDQDDVT